MVEAETAYLLASIDKDAVKAGRVGLCSEEHEGVPLMSDEFQDADVSKLVLYVAGETPKSLAAISNLERICREHLDGKYAVEVIDLKKQPHLAREHSIVAIPTLVRQLPVPIRKTIGDLSDTHKVLISLNVNANP